MAGTVIEVLVKAGDIILGGQEVIIIESMKMQLPVQAEMEGKVTQIRVSSGDFVNEGDALIVLD